MLSLSPTPEQQQITDAVRDVLTSEWPIDRFRQAGGAGDAGRWQTLPDLGVLGMGLETSYGGLGLSAIEEALAFREFGRFLVPPRILATVLGARVAAAAGCAQLCASMLAGQVVVGILNAVSEPSLGVHVSGRFLVVDGAECDVLLAWSPSGAALVSRSTAQPTASRKSMDETITVESCELKEAEALAWVDAADEPVYLRADTLLAAMLVGIAEATRDMAAHYATLREAFGQQIGEFQAIKHRCADTAVQAEAAWCQTLVAAIGLRDAANHARDDVTLDVAAARWIATRAAQANAESNIQVHGGIGFSAEADPHRYVKRAVVLGQLGVLGRMLSADLLAPASAN